MRNVLLAVLMATAATTPAFAQPNDQDNRQQQREERQQAREERQQAHEERQQAQQQERQANVERNQAAQQQRLTQQAAQQQQQQFNRNVRFEQQQARQQQQTYDRTARIEQQNAARDSRQSERDARQQQREYQRQLATQRPSPHYVAPTPVVSNTPSPGTQPPPRYGNRPGYTHSWNTNWRNNGHYDWHNYRNNHRSLFHLGYYYDPYGWGYQPLSIGWRLWPNYYSSNYWINDPWMYRLPYAPPGYAWVSYFNDAILVDTWSGQVVDVIPGFFW